MAPTNYIFYSGVVAPTTPATHKPHIWGQCVSHHALGMAGIYDGLTKLKTSLDNITVLTI